MDQATVFPSRPFSARNCPSQSFYAGSSLPCVKQLYLGQGRREQVAAAAVLVEGEAIRGAGRRSAWQILGNKKCHSVQRCTTAHNIKPRWDV